MIRTFLAVELADALRRDVAELQRDLKAALGPGQIGRARISWPQPASMHLTLKFYGDIDERLVDPLQVAIAAAVSATRGLDVPFERLGAFPRPDEPRVLWVGASHTWERGDAGRRLAALHQAIEDASLTLGFPPEGRPFSPHLTLGRIRSGERPVGRALVQSGALNRTVAIGSIGVASIACLKSDLRPDGPVHTKLWEVRLTGT